MVPSIKRGKIKIRAFKEKIKKEEIYKWEIPESLSRFIFVYNEIRIMKSSKQKKNKNIQKDKKQSQNGLFPED